jgi:protein-L-isoaspartate(D-aspartate) O-methyltransferase
MIDFEARRNAMVDAQLAGRGIRDAAVLQAMRSVPRERFVGTHQAPLAYADGPLPIAEGQTISQPFIVAAMLEAAAIGPGDRVLEVGTGSGYAAAVLGRLAARVTTIERHGALADAARERLAALGCGNVEVVQGDGSLGWPAAAPYDAILVAAAGPEVPAALKAQLAIGGRLVMPVGVADAQELVKLTRRTEDEFDREALGGVMFVALIGAQGWTAGT